MLIINAHYQCLKRFAQVHRTPLHNAASVSHGAACVKVLLNAGAKVDVEDEVL